MRIYRNKTYRQIFIYVCIIYIITRICINIYNYPLRYTYKLIDVENNNSETNKFTKNTQKSI